MTVSDTIGEKSLNEYENTGKKFFKAVDTIEKVIYEPIKSAIEISDTYRKQFEGVWEDVKEMELLKAEGTWQIVTKQSIMTFLDAMVRRTKLHCLIVVPDMSLLPVKAIEQTKMRQKVTIACKITDKDLAKNWLKWITLIYGKFLIFLLMYLVLTAIKKKLFMGQLPKNWMKWFVR